MDLSGELIDRAGGVIEARYVVNALHFHMFQRFSTSTSPSYCTCYFLLYNLGSPHMARMTVKSNKPIINKNQDGVPQESPCLCQSSRNGSACEMVPKSHCFKDSQQSFHTSPPLTSFLSLKLHLTFHCMSLPPSFSTTTCSQQRRPHCHQLCSQRSLF